MVNSLRLKPSLLALLPFFLASCVDYGSLGRVVAPLTDDEVGKVSKRPQINLDVEILKIENRIRGIEEGETPEETEARKTKEKEETLQVRMQIQMQVRNELQSPIIGRSIRVCREHINNITLAAAQVGTALDIVALGSSAAVPIVSGGLAESILGGVAATAIGTEATLESRFFGGQERSLLGQTIEKARSDKFEAIRGKRGRSLAEYPLQEAVTDARDYHSTCSFIRALESLVTNEAAQERRRQGELAANRRAVQVRIDIVRFMLGETNLSEQRKGVLEDELKEKKAELQAINRALGLPTI